jgi:hypothetical protein
VAERRQLALERVRQLGCDATAELPTVDVTSVREVDEVRARCLALYACVAVSFGLDRGVASHWIETAGLRPALTEAEVTFLAGSDGDSTPSYQAAIESLWALAWALEVVPVLDWTQPCANDFIRQFPDPRRGDSDSPIQRATSVRPADEVALELDVAYLLHHCDTESRLADAPSPLAVAPHVVERRRWALEWLVTPVDWDDVELDT